MIVSNEQAKAFAECKLDCENCNAREICYDFTGQETCSKLGLEILKARELIKEMRAGLEYINCLNINPLTTELSNTERWVFASQKAKALLEKTKEYAE